MPLLDPRLLTALARMRLQTVLGQPAGGVGDRPSQVKGSGFEFSGHRPYQPGDDIRRLDPHVEARLGQPFVREYRVDQQLPVTVVVDGSASMAFGEPSKLDFARRLAATLAYVALVGNDRVRLVHANGGKLHWSPWFASARAHEELFHWLEAQKAGGIVDFSELARALGPRLPQRGLVFILSDWLFASPVTGMRWLQREGRELVALQVYAPEEAQPALAESIGELRLMDAETGEPLDVALDAAILTAFEQRWKDWVQELRRSLLAERVMLRSLAVDGDFERVVHRELIGAGLIR